jgi:Rieske Fe-S protein
MTTEKKSLDRRQLLVLGAASVLPACSAGGADPSLWESGGNPPPGSGAGGGSGSTTTVTSSSSASSSSTSGATSSSTSGGMSCPTTSNSQRLDFSTHPQLMSAGGTVSFQGSGYSDPSCQQPDIIVVAQGGGQYLAFSASCSHACCTVSYNGSGFRCPCHNALFDTSGACTNGRAPDPLAPLMVCADATGITVTW